MSIPNFATMANRRNGRANSLASGAIREDTHETDATRFQNY